MRSFSRPLPSESLSQASETIKSKEKQFGRKYVKQSYRLETKAAFTKESLNIYLIQVSGFTPLDNLQQSPCCLARK
jgi:hypothetical protein